jgi:adenosylcobinamide-GDP ribazoletransferase
MAFLTAIPVKMDESFLDISARYMYLFPVIGTLIGLIVGAYAWFTNSVLFLLAGAINNLVFSGTQTVFFNFAAKGLASAMIIAFLFVVIGLQHTDGLVDVGNALGIRQASLKDKIDIAHEWTVTRTGALLAVLVFIITFLLILLTKTEIIIQVLIIAEVSAKLAMVTTGWLGNSPPPRYYENRWEKGRSFIDCINKNHKLFAISVGISIIVSFILLSFSGVLAIITGMLVGFFMIFVGNHVFEGVNGDVFGATNEIARMFSLFVLVII